VLFVEGKEESLDQAIYRACYPEWTIIPRGSCEEVIHAVKTFRANSALTRVTCAGIVDADAHTDEDEDYLRSKGIAILPVSEIENLFLLPQVISEILVDNGHGGDELNGKQRAIYDELIEHANDEKNQEASVLEYCRRSIDKTLKRIDFSSAKTVAEVTSFYSINTSALDIEQIAAIARGNIQRAIKDGDIPLLLKWYDNKGVMSIACRARDTNVVNFKQWLVRSLRNNTAPKVAAAIKSVLPDVQAT